MARVVGAWSSSVLSWFGVVVAVGLRPLPLPPSVLLVLPSDLAHRLRLTVALRRRSLSDISFSSGRPFSSSPVSARPLRCLHRDEGGDAAASWLGLWASLSSSPWVSARFRFPCPDSLLRPLSSSRVPWFWKFLCCGVGSNAGSARSSKQVGSEVLPAAVMLSHHL